MVRSSAAGDCPAADQISDAPLCQSTGIGADLWGQPIPSIAYPLMTSAPLGTVNLKWSGDIGGFFCMLANVSSVTLPNAS
ncbi:hypothetical protein PPN31114_04847 [Pandoraea pneumonica]|uniref:Uncharacterized protein n=1 Tax=Pandoraea pneumonica TaxID=2508299 RepID=A0A5E4YX30_9BURK|nr:hypothetical protein PPN31114_04847 [Pandoraea pneumonica]